MYDYRGMTPAQQAVVVDERRRRGFPWHAPPHLTDVPGFRIVTGACCGHQPRLDSVQKLAWFEKQLLASLTSWAVECAAWCVLPNHYHLLIKIVDMKRIGRQLGQLHGRTSYELNTKDSTRGRKVWYRCQDRVMRSERHFYTSINYIHNNPVKHAYVQKWQQWPFSSVHWYFDSKGRDWLLDLWREYPVLNYGAKWDLF